MLAVVMRLVFKTDFANGLQDLTCPKGRTSSQYNPMISRSRGYVPNHALKSVIVSYVAVKLRIDVLDSELPPVVRPYVVGTPLSPPSHIKLPYPITLFARAKYDYYIPRESFNLIGMFQNPMMMIMLFTGVMVLAMPYIMVSFLRWCRQQS